MTLPLADLSRISIDPAAPREIRILDFKRQLHNPLCFKCGPFLVYTQCPEAAPSPENYLRRFPSSEALYGRPLFSGLLRCGCCGGNLTHKINRAAGRRYEYYYCQYGKGHGCTRPSMVRADELATCLLIVVRSLFLAFGDPADAPTVLSRELLVSLIDSVQVLARHEILLSFRYRLPWRDH